MLPFHQPSTWRLPHLGRLALGGALAASVLAACGSTSSPSSSPARGGAPAASAVGAGVTLRVGDQEQRLQTLLEASGELKGAAFSVTWADFTSGPPELQALEAGSLDAAGDVGDTPPIFAAAAGGGGANLRIVAAARTQGGDSDAIVVPKGSSITTLAGLKGKKVAVTRGSSGHLTLLLALQKAGLTWSDITPVYLQPTQAQPAFAQGSIDAWAVWYPFVSVATATSGRVLTTGADLDPGYSFLLSDTATLANSARSAALGDLVRRIAAANQWAVTHVSTWALRFAGISQLSDAEATTTVQHSLAVSVPADATVVAAEQQAADSFTAAGLIPHVPVAPIVDNRYQAQLTASS